MEGEGGGKVRDSEMKQKGRKLMKFTSAQGISTTLKIILKRIHSILHNYNDDHTVFLMFKSTEVV